MLLLGEDLVIPYLYLWDTVIQLMFFAKAEIPEITNSELQVAIDLVGDATDKEEAVKIAFELVVNKFRGYRFRTYILFWRSWESDPNELWKRSGFLHCMQQNYLVRVLLVKSGWFEEDEIGLGFSLVWYLSPHQYLRVKIGEREVAIDPWNYRFGVGIGRYARGFGSGVLGEK